MTGPFNLVVDGFETTICCHLDDGSINPSPTADLSAVLILVTDNSDPEYDHGISFKGLLLRKVADPAMLKVEAGLRMRTFQRVGNFWAAYGDELGIADGTYRFER